MLKVLLVLFSVCFAMEPKLKKIIGDQIEKNGFIRVSNYGPSREYIKLELEHDCIKVYKIKRSLKKEKLREIIPFPKFVFDSKRTFMNFICHVLCKYAKDCKRALIVDKSDIYKGQVSVKGSPRLPNPVPKPRRTKEGETSIKLVSTECLKKTSIEPLREIKTDSDKIKTNSEPRIFLQEKYVHTNKIQRLFQTNIKKEIEEELEAFFSPPRYSLQNIYYMDYKEYNLIQEPQTNVLHVYNIHNKVKLLLHLSNSENTFFSSILLSDFITPETINEIKSKTLNKDFESKDKKKLDQYFNYNIFGFNFIENVISKNTSIIPLIKWILEKHTRNEVKKETEKTRELILDFLFLNMIYSKEFSGLNLEFLRSQTDDKIKDHLDALQELNVVELSIFDRTQGFKDKNKLEIYDQNRYNFSVLSEFANIIMLLDNPRMAKEDKEILNRKYNLFKLVRDNMLNSLSCISKRCSMSSLYKDADFVEAMKEVFKTCVNELECIYIETLNRITTALSNCIKVNNLKLQLKYDFYVPKQQNAKGANKNISKNYQSKDSIVHKLDAERLNIPFSFQI
ncbi:hypothetical protein NGRA_0560 [Nosema granulosis]|uniref:Uncharacterized protein n=1 Tax=Nosema granulosis TaxID=83296 RepID=A0A9P6H053_9MICR|nr:hypothetical protein NGRA_0560 [Nosema granulosis]